MSDKYIMVDGEPRPVDDVVTWGRWMQENHDQKRVAFTEIAPGLTVSTVFLGLDHSFGGGPPILFETMVFGGDWAEQEMDRYATIKEARLGHAAAVTKVMEELTNGR